MHYLVLLPHQQRPYIPGGASSSSSTLSKLKTMAGYANFVPPGASASHIHTATSYLARGRGAGGRGGRGQQRPYNRYVDWFGPVKNFLLAFPICDTVFV